MNGFKIIQLYIQLVSIIMGQRHSVYCRLYYSYLLKTLLMDYPSQIHLEATKNTYSNLYMYMFDFTKVEPSTQISMYVKLVKNICIEYDPLEALLVGLSNLYYDIFKQQPLRLSNHRLKSNKASMDSMVSSKMLLRITG